MTRNHFTSAISTLCNYYGSPDTSGRTALSAEDDYRQTGNDMLMGLLPDNVWARARSCDNIVIQYICTQNDRIWYRLCIFERQLAWNIVAARVRCVCLIEDVIVLYFRNQVELHCWVYSTFRHRARHLYTLAAYSINIRVDLSHRFSADIVMVN